MNLYFLKSNYFLFLAFIFIIGFGYLNFTKYKNTDNSEINLLKQEYTEAQNQNKNLASLAEYYKTDVYLERQAREKFKMAKPGEEIIIIQEIENPKIKLDSYKKDMPNFIKWWYYIFYNN